MWLYIVRRLVVLIPLVWAIITFTFLALHATPGDPVTEMIEEIQPGPEMEQMLRERFGLDQPLHVQYFRYLTGVLRGDLGRSITTQAPVMDEIILRFPSTLQLAFAGMGVAIVIGLVFGIIAAVTRVPGAGFGIMVGALVGISMPNFWLGLMLILFLGVELGWFPVLGGSGIHALVLPAITLGVSSGAVLARLTRSSMLEIVRQDYIRTALAKGLREQVVIYRHALRNALIPIVTVMGIQFGNLLGGTVIVESVFARAGVGRVAIDAIQQRDIPLVLGVVIFFAVIYIITNLLVDISYGFLDPRIRYE